MAEIKKQIEELREKLNKLIAEDDYYNNEKVLKISQELDKIINKYIKS